MCQIPYALSASGKGANDDTFQKRSNSHPSRARVVTVVSLCPLYRSPNKLQLLALHCLVA